MSNFTKFLFIIFMISISLEAGIYKVTQSYIIVQISGGTYVGDESDQTYSLNPTLLDSGDNIVIIDKGGNNTIELVAGLTITSSTIASNEILLNLSNGTSINIRGADRFTFDIGANKAASIIGEKQNFNRFITDKLGFSNVPSQGEIAAYNESVNIQEDEINSLPIFIDAKENSQERYNFAIENGANIVQTEDQKSFYLHWLPKTIDSESNPPLIVTLHGSESFALDSFYVWHESAQNYNYGILALQWWINTENVDNGGYYSPLELYPIISNILRELDYEPSSVIFHGFSRGSANSYILAAIDANNNRFFEMIISNAGGATMTYQPNIDIDNSVYGNMPFQNIPWVLYGGANDPNPERDGIPAMARTKDWIESHGADVRLFIQDEDGDHGGFHMDSENVNAALDIYEDIKNDILP